MKRALIAVPAALLLALAACSDDGEPEDGDPADTAANTATSEEASTGPVELDLTEADGACPLIDSAQLNSVTGEDFRFASGGSGEDAETPTQMTCAMQTGEAAYPDLTLFVIGTEASVEVYEEELTDGVETVDGLGEAAYWIVHTEDTGAGPALEMGWYDGGTIFEMRYTTPEATDAAAVNALVPGFTELAQGIAAAHSAN
ncbi:hypothetical protein K3N28_17720 [Glycomyces sp. TRM65418]|uniref:hypothetical protein n=1 Tax=Glycomyces sp. TRM65418 TaxID=2867006 RepID=UPI001CE601EE|nr:hypothetical protein [Glycomyces sp. TRM65418]MCC3764900.1 hypothetical protein [Glycomyces sp. TRM65418]QZD54541.1 hypothetical protein K3N28_17635 [Glycomyces sp. TRM65418]